MKLFVLLFAIIGLAAAANLPIDEDFLEVDNENIQTYGLITRAGARSILKKISKQMPEGWPEYGIPPLAPLDISELNLSINKYLFSTNTEIKNLSIGGLDNFKVNDAKINTLKKKLNLDITFPVLTITAEEYNTDNIVDALEKLGVKFELKTAGGLELTLVNVRVQLRIRYKIPVLWGSNKITSCDTYLTIDEATANFENLLGNGELNKFVNRLIGEQISIAVLKMEDEISEAVQEYVIPLVNTSLKGTGFWTIIKEILLP